MRYVIHKPSRVAPQKPSRMTNKLICQSKAMPITILKDKF